MKHFNILTMSLLSSTSVFGVHPVKFETQVLAIDANEGVAVADLTRTESLMSQPVAIGIAIPESPEHGCRGLCALSKTRVAMPTPTVSMLMMSMGTVGSMSCRTVFGCPK